MSAASDLDQETITIDAFYEKQKELYDICGVFINKDKYPFIDILARYLTDIVGLIDVEIKNSARNSMINWREKKNPKLLSRLINSDDNVNLINLSMNKITTTNYKNIVAEITDALINDNPRKLPDYCKFLFDVIIKKCMVDEAFAKDYIRFLFGFSDSIARNLGEYINGFISEVGRFLTTNESIKEYGYFHYVKDVTLWRNIGVIYANMFNLMNKSGTMVGKLNVSEVCGKLVEQFNILFNTLDWLPANMDELNGRLYLTMAIMENLLNDIWWHFDDKARKLFSEILTLTYACNNIPNKIKFKVLDLQDMIKNIRPADASVVKLKTEVIITSDVNNRASASSHDASATANASNSANIIEKSTDEPVQSKANIWETRKQQIAAAPVTDVNADVNVNAVSEQRQLSTTTESKGDRRRDNSRNHSRNISGNSSNNYSRNGNSNGDGRRNGGNDSRRREGSRNKEVVEEVRVQKNMFSGLESGDSNDEHDSRKQTGKNQTPAEDDGFVTVEKKSKNVYKPKKTPELALEGSKIYSNGKRKQ